MRIAQVIGTVTLNRSHPTFSGTRLKIAVPASLDVLSAQSEPEWGDESLVVYDDLGADTGSWIMVSEGGEAAQPFRPEEKPVDAYNAGILDRIDIGATKT